MRGFDVSCLSGSLMRFVDAFRSCVCRLYSGMFIGVERCGSLVEVSTFVGSSFAQSKKRRNTIYIHSVG